MNSMKWVIAAVVGTLVLAPLPVLAQKAGQDGYQVGQRLGQTGKAGSGRFREISWDDLIPADWNPEKFFLDLKLNDLQDNDPRAAEVMQKIREEWDRAPLVQRFNGERIRIPGFIVPLETDGKTIRALGAPMGNDLDAEEWYVTRYRQVKARVALWPSLRRLSTTGRNLLLQTVY